MQSNHNFTYYLLCKDCGATAEEIDDAYVSAICTKAPQTTKHKLRLRKLRSDMRKHKKVLLKDIESKLEFI